VPADELLPFRPGLGTIEFPHVSKQRMAAIVEDARATLAKKTGKPILGVGRRLSSLSANETATLPVDTQHEPSVISGLSNAPDSKQRRVSLDWKEQDPDLALQYMNQAGQLPLMS
jgi:hypothetical protein